MLELGAVENPKAQGDDGGGEQNRPRDGLAQEYPAIEGSEDRTEKADERHECRRESLEEHAIKIIADNIV